MNFGGAQTWAATPWGALATGAGLSTPDPFVVFMQKIDSLLIFVLETTPIDVGGPDVVLRVSDKGLLTSGADTPANIIISPRLRTPYNFETSVPLPGARESSRGQASLGTLTLQNDDGVLDAFLSRIWEGRELLIKVGGTQDPGRPDERVLLFSEYGILFRGVVEEVTSSRVEISISVQDPFLQLDTEIQPTLYLGDDLPETLEGDTTIEGLPKPLTFGTAFNVPGVLVNAGFLVYQFHDSDVEAFNEVRDKGVALINDGDITDLALSDVFDAGWTPVIGHYITDKALGLVRLGGAPAGAITADVDGDNTGGFVTTTADVIRRIAVSRGGLDASTQVDGASFLSFKHRGIIGYHVGTSSVAVGSVLRSLAAGADGFVTFTRKGKLRLRVWDNPSTVLETKETLSNVTGFVNVEEPGRHMTWRVRFGYQPVWLVQSEDELAGSVTADEKALYSKVRRFVVFEEAQTKTDSPVANEVEIDSFFALRADAEFVAESIKNRDSVRRRFFRYTAGSADFQRELGDTVLLQLPQQNLDVGLRCLITGIAEVGATRRVDLELWG